ncbi:AAA family ATPase [Flavobacterium sp.]|uniref:AAA family ATPase n=5 Tax=Flavobacterium sp. TaxID=239 RepID=UPI0040472CD0
MKIKKTTIIKYINEIELWDKKDIPFLNNSMKLSDEEINFPYADLSNNLIDFIIKNDELINFEDKAILTLATSVEKKNSKINDFWNKKINDLATIINIYEENLKNLNYNFDYTFNKHKYPVKVKMTLINATKYFPRHIVLIYNLSVQNSFHEIELKITYEDILNLKATSENLTFKYLFNLLSLEEQVLDIKKFKEKLIKRDEIYRGSNKIFLSNGYGNSSYRTNPKFIKNKVIIEEELELENCGNFFNSYRNNYKPAIYTDLPLIRCFSLELKQYFYIDVDEICPYEFKTINLNELVINPNNKLLISKIFNTYLFEENDIIEYKGNGIIVLAWGEPGTGKTLTSEIYSENNRRPLYILRIDELGTSLESIEKNLSIVLDRIQKWNAVLLLDEAEIFLSHRDKDLNKSAIVGIFLKLLEYFNGIIFLTTNKINDLDDAILSRVTLALHYPNLDEKAREIIWNNVLKKNNTKLETTKNLSKIQLSSRDIRNYAKLASIAFDEIKSENEIIHLIKTYPKFK